MSWSRVQAASGSTSSGDPQATFTTANVTSGNKILAFVALSAASAVTCSTVKDGAGNSWTKAGAAANGDNEASIWFLDVPAGDAGAKPAITATPSVTSGGSIVVQEISGLMAGNTTAVLDGTAATLTGTAATTGSPSYSTNAAGEYLVAVYGDAGFDATVAAQTSPVWTLDASSVNTNGDADCCVEYKNSVGSTETNGFTGAGSVWEIVEVAFLLAASGIGPALNPGPLPNFPVIIASDAGWRGAGHSR